jgi:hypothetical protein
VAAPTPHRETDARHLKPLRPDMQVVYMSAYTSERFGGELDQDSILRKPFSEGTITLKIRQTLDASKP